LFLVKDFQDHFSQQTGIGSNMSKLQDKNLPILRRRLHWKNVSQSGGHSYRAFHRFGQAKFPNGGSVLGSSQFPMLRKYDFFVDIKNFLWKIINPI
jgi:hypothetical protein